LFGGYNAFYERTWPTDRYDVAWREFQDGDRVHALGGCARLYWLTRENNHAARRLYDQVAENRGFIQYVIPL
jgi:hypothetical protein